MKSDKKEIKENFLTRKKFSQMVEDTVPEVGTYLDTILHLCEKNGLELLDAKKYLTKPVREKLEAEAMDLNLLEKQNSLPL